MVARGDEGPSSGAPASASEPSAVDASPEVPEEFDAERLKTFNGEGGSPIYVSVRGIVYDCSSASDLYGPGKAYNVFVGKEISRSLAKMTIDDVEANAGWSNLSTEHEHCLQEWVELYASKYPVAGVFKKDPHFDARGLAMEP